MRNPQLLQEEGGGTYNGVSLEGEVQLDSVTWSPGQVVGQFTPQFILLEGHPCPNTSSAASNMQNNRNFPGTTTAHLGNCTLTMPGGGLLAKLGQARGATSSVSRGGP